MSPNTWATGCWSISATREAHEDDAERAVRAGLAVIDAVRALNLPQPLAVRLGIASGLVVVGDLIGEGAAQERGVVGETPNLAARLQAIAAPNRVVIADGTRRQLGGLFEVEDLGPQALPGFAEAPRAWQVVGESGVVSRFEALRPQATPLVGRDEELDLLLRRWRQAKAGEGRVVLIAGEPGIGKSRLTAALAASIAGEPHTRLRYFASPHHQESALYPFVVQLERAAGFARDDTPDAKLGKLEALIAGGAAEPDEITLIAELLALPNAAAGLDMSPRRKREKLLTGLLHQLEALAKSHPVLMVFEDAHWIDPTSRDLIDLTVDRIRRLPVLLLVTFRPEFQPPWTDQPHVTTLALNRLGERDGSALVEQLAGNAGVSSELVAEIVERSDGVPLFIEELTKAVVEAGADRGALTVSGAPASALAVPATLHASLLGRLDRLGPTAKLVAQAGAAIGREFSFDLLAAAAELAEQEPQDALQRLVGSGLVFQRGVPPASEYLFKHALVQDTAYSTLLRGPRQALHRRIAVALEAQFPSVLAARPELAAHHYGEAGMAEKAVPYWLLAGKLSVAKIGPGGGDRAASPRSWPLEQPARDVSAQRSRARPPYPFDGGADRRQGLRACGSLRRLGPLAAARRRHGGNRNAASLPRPVRLLGGGRRQRKRQGVVGTRATISCAGGDAARCGAAPDRPPDAWDRAVIDR